MIRQCISVVMGSALLTSCALFDPQWKTRYPYLVPANERAQSSAQDQTVEVAPVLTSEDSGQAVPRSVSAPAATPAPVVTTGGGNEPKVIVCAVC